MNTNSMLDKKSRYVSGGISEREGAGLGWWERKKLDHSPNDQFVVVTGRHVGRIDLIAYDFLGDVKYWWLIAQYNDIIDPWGEIVEGKYIRIPPQSLLSMLSSKVGGVASQREVPTNYIQPIV